MAIEFLCGVCPEPILFKTPELDKMNMKAITLTAVTFGLRQHLRDTGHTDFRAVAGRTYVTIDVLEIEGRREVLLSAEPLAVEVPLVSFPVYLGSPNSFSLS